MLPTRTLFFGLFALTLGLAGCSGSTGDDDTESPTPLPATPTPEPELVDNDRDGYVAMPAGEDCNDDDKSINPSADEQCDKIDNDCDGNIDEDPVDGTSFFQDADGDKYGDRTQVTRACNAPTGYVKDATDCNDDDADINPGETEVCGDGLDNNCDSSAGTCGYGGDMSLTTSSAVIVGEQAGAALGTVVLNPGDLDGDGADDFAVSAPSHDAEKDNAGVVYIFKGPFASSPVLSNTLARITGNEEGGKFGRTMVSLDANGDGEADLAVGAPESNLGGALSGAVYVFFGPLTGTLSSNDADVSIRGIPNAQLGLALDRAGDINGDGHEDLLIGAPYEGTDENARRGSAFLMWGPLTGTPVVTEGIRFTGTSSYGYAGRTVAGVGDLNNDGFDDMAIGAPFYETAEVSTAGAAYIFHGPLTDAVNLSPSDADGTLLGASSTRVGSAIAPAGDLNGDGKGDLLISAPYASSNNASSVGEVYLFAGPASGTLSTANALATFQGAEAGALLGAALLSPGDLTGDGKADILIGADGEIRGRTSLKSVYLLAGPFSGLKVTSTENVTARFISTNTNDYLGRSVTVGNYGDSARPDIVLGVPTRNEDMAFTGEAYFFYAGEGL
ncbi:MAG: MopE-related protein [Myxococcota bacterium]